MALDIDTAITLQTSETGDFSDAVTQFEAVDVPPSTTVSAFQGYYILQAGSNQSLIPASIQQRVTSLYVRNHHNVDSVDLTFYTLAQFYPTTSMVRLAPGQACYLTDLNGQSAPTVTAYRVASTGTELFYLEVIGAGY